MQAQAQTLKLISYNIHHGADAAEQPTLQAMGAFIKKTGADLVGLQEVDSMCNRSGRVDQMKELARITGMHYAFYRHFEYDGGAYGLGILSKFPIKQQWNQRISSVKKGKRGSLAFLSVQVQLGERKLRFATVHLALDQPTRMVQTGEVMDYLKGAGPVIITGDFNALPDTPELELIKAKLPSADTADLLTFPAGGPVKTIDYILGSPEIMESRKQAYTWKEALYSDHLPLGTTLYWQ
ncbi:hypothetical protein GCM10027051_36280 [Niabella terrae]